MRLFRLADLDVRSQFSVCLSADRKVYNCYGSPCGQNDRDLLRGYITAIFTRFTYSQRELFWEAIYEDMHSRQMVIDLHRARFEFSRSVRSGFSQATLDK